MQTFTWTINHAPSVTNPGDQINIAGRSLVLDIALSDLDQGDTLTAAINSPFALSGLPAGLDWTLVPTPGHGNNQNFRTIRITGQPTTAGHLSVHVTATDNHGASSQTAVFDWRIVTETQADIEVSATDPDVGAGRVSTVNTGLLPLQGLSKYNANFAAIYEKGPISARLAYNWRSDFLLTVRDVIVPYAPIMNEATGQLDGSLFYTINPKVKIGVQGVS